MKYLVLSLLPLSIFSQEITGKVYDSETTVKGIDVFNISQKTIAYTDNEGRFTIHAKVDDTLSFHSTFHNQKIVKLKQEDFNDVMVIELKKTINRLNEILISNNLDPDAFKDTKEEQSIKQTITEDSKVNPHLYTTSSSYGLDFIRLAGLVGKLLKKNKDQKQTKQIIHATSLDSLFKNDDFFTPKLINQDLKISKSEEKLFFEFCETQKLDKKLIENENKLLLLEELVVLSLEHQKRSKSSVKH